MSIKLSPLVLMNDSVAPVLEKIAEFLEKRAL